MIKENGIVSVHSDDISYYDLQEALVGDEEDSIFTLIDDEAKRGFQDVEWIMFVLMTIPVAESVINIVSMIKNKIQNGVSEQMTLQRIKKTVRVKVKIKLPLFLYEKEEEIIIEPKENN